MQIEALEQLEASERAGAAGRVALGGARSRRGVAEHPRRAGAARSCSGVCDAARRGGADRRRAAAGRGDAGGRRRAARARERGDHRTPTPSGGELPGVLVAPLAHERGNYIAWFRPEWVHTVDLGARAEEPRGGRTGSRRRARSARGRSRSRDGRSRGWAVEVESVSRAAQRDRDVPDHPRRAARRAERRARALQRGARRVRLRRRARSQGAAARDRELRDVPGRGLRGRAGRRGPRAAGDDPAALAADEQRCWTRCWSTRGSGGPTSS